MTVDPFDLDLQPGHGDIEIGHVCDGTESTANATDEPVAESSAEPIVTADDPTEAWIHRQNEQIQVAMANSGRETASRDIVIRGSAQDPEFAIHGWAYRIVLPYEGPGDWRYSAGVTGWEHDEAIEYGRAALAERGCTGRIEIATLRLGWDPLVGIFDIDALLDMANERSAEDMVSDDDGDVFENMTQTDGNQLVLMLHEAWLRWCAMHRPLLKCMHFAGPIITILAEDEAPGDLDAEGST